MEFWILSCLGLEEIKHQIITTGTCCLKLACSKEDADKKLNSMGCECNAYRVFIVEELNVSQRRCKTSQRVSTGI